MNRILKKSRIALVMFCVGYFTTVNVNAQGAGAIQLNSNDTAVITGTVKEADENFIIIDSAGKEMKIVLDDVKLKAPADTMFERGMLVSVDGEITGEDFGVPLVKAKSVTATEAPADIVRE